MFATVRLPPLSSAKLAELQAVAGNKELVARVKQWLAIMETDSSVFAPAPPTDLPGGADLLAEIAETRKSIAHLSASIDRLLCLSPDLQASFESEDNSAFEAMVARRLHLERTEEALIVAALAKGLKVQRRPDCDPRAVLELVEVECLAEAV